MTVFLCTILSVSKSTKGNARGALEASAREYVGYSRDRYVVVGGGPFLPLTCSFRQSQEDNESETNVKYNS